MKQYLSPLKWDWLLIIDDFFFDGFDWFGRIDINSTASELGEHLEGSNWLVHWHHMACFVYSQEFEILVSFELTSDCIINLPLLILCLVVVTLAFPIASKCPSFTTSPVADEIFVTRVDEHIKSLIIQDIGNLWSQVGHPITEKGCVHFSSTLCPRSTFNSKDFLDGSILHHVVSWGHIIAKWWLVAALSDIIDIESRRDWTSENSCGHKLTNLKGNWPNTSGNETLASLESSPEDIVLSSIDQFVFKRESVISRVLEIRVYKTITDGESLEVNLEVSLMLELEVV